ncbi:unnamed protein product, partial [Callosobruchus maculatus]
MSWIIVKFLESDEVEVVPKSWYCEDKKMVKFPGYKPSKIIHAIKSQMTPQDCWKSFSVVLLRNGETFDSLHLASKKAQKACYTSDVSEVEEYQLNKRRPKKKVFSSDESSSELELDAPPKSFPKESFSKNLDTPMERPKESNTADDSDTKFKKSVLTFLHRITKQISDLEKQLDSWSVQQCQHNFKGEVDQNKEEYENVYQQLPIESEEALRGIEKKLDDSQLSTYLVGCLQKIGGTNYKEATRRISKRVISDKVAVHYSLKGHKSKQPFMNLKICALIIEAVQSCIKDTVSSKEIELALGVYLAKASERLKKNTEG